MKTGFFTLAALAAGLAAAQPHRNNPRHAGMHEKRDYATEYDVVTVTAAAVVVYVSGTTTWTETQYTAQTTEASSTTEVSSTPSPSSVYVATSSVSAADFAASEVASSTPVAAASSAEPTTLATSVAPTTAQASSTEEASSTQEAFTQEASPAASSAASSVADTASSGNGFGISYNPYASDGSCKDQSAVSDDINTLSAYSTIRIYGTDCNQTQTVLHAVAQHPGMKLFLGISDISDATNEANLIISSVNDQLGSDWSRIDTVSVGNEAVTSGSASVSDVVSALNSVRSTLRAATPNPYTGPVVTVEQVGAILDSADGSGLQLCQNSDYTAANCHAFFDTSGDYTTGSQAGEFVSMQYARLQKGCGANRTVISESGWPWNSVLPASDFSGDVAVPSEANQVEAVKSLKNAFKGIEGDLVLFSAFDDLWKSNGDGTKGAEGYWGIMGHQT